MKAMILSEISSFVENREPLQMVDLPDPVPGEGEILIRISACGVCHTELDEIEGRTPPPRFPMVLGHQVVGKVIETGKGADRKAWRPGRNRLDLFCLRKMRVLH